MDVTPDFDRWTQRLGGWVDRVLDDGTPYREREVVALTLEEVAQVATEALAARIPTATPTFPEVASRGVVEIRPSPILGLAGGEAVRRRREVDQQQRSHRKHRRALVWNHWCRVRRGHGPQ